MSSGDVPRYSENDIFDAYERLGWTLHDVAMLVATLEEMKEEEA